MGSAINRLIVTSSGLLFVGYVVKPTEHSFIFRVIVTFILVLAYSMSITMILLVLGIENIILVNGTISSEKASLFFPVSIVGWAGPIGNTTQFFGINFPRAYGMFIEPGIFQLYVILAFFGLPLVGKDKWYNKTALIITLIATFSLAGFIGFIICYLYKLIYINRIYSAKDLLPKYLLIILLVLLSYNIYTADVINRKISLDPSNLSAGSVYSRYVVTTAIFSDTFSGNRLFGMGFKEDVSDLVGFDITAVNILASSTHIGLIGVLLLLLWTYYALRTNYNKYTIIIFLPVLITALTSQNIHFDPIYYCMLTLKTSTWSPQ